jgi:hypothetical protein
MSYDFNGHAASEDYVGWVPEEPYTPFSSGFVAGQNGVNSWDNPYYLGHESFAKWHRGWSVADDLKHRDK